MLLLTELPKDCIDTVLCHLALQDCLTLGTTCQSLLSDVQSELYKRRQRLVVPHCYSIHSVKPVLHKMADQGKVRDARTIPSVKDRVESLCRVMPLSHPSVGDVVRLRKCLRQDMSGPEGNQDDENEEYYLDSCDLTDCGSIDQARVAKVIRAHRANLECFRLHAKILSTVVQSNPSIASATRGYVSVGQRCDRVMTVTLERYIGDVLCATYLMGHVAAGLVEGSPTEEQWIDGIVDGIGLQTHDLTSCCDTGTLSPKDVPSHAWYNAWVFLHSSLLRTAPLSKDHQQRLGLHFVPTIPEPHDGSVAGGAAAATVTKSPMSAMLQLDMRTPFAGARKAMLLRGLARVSTFESIRITFRDFGPLGPAFRGRDVVRTQSMPPTSLITAVIAFETDPGSWNPQQDSVLQWLLQTREEATRTRPMTVSPPLVTIRCSV